MASTVLILISIFLQIAHVTGKFFYSSQGSMDSSIILNLLQDVSVTSCQLSCDRNIHCASIALPQKPLLGEIGDCYLIKKGLESGKKNGDLKMLHVLDLKLTPTGCYGDQIPIINDQCEPDKVDKTGSGGDGGVLPTTTPKPPTNIALNKNVQVSMRMLDPSKVVDGDVSGDFFTKPGDNNPFVKIDLGGLAKVYRVLLYEGKSVQNIEDSEVKIGSSPLQLCGVVHSTDKEYDTENERSYYKVECGLPPLIGQYVQVQLMKDGTFIRTNEIEVYGVLL